MRVRSVLLAAWPLLLCGATVSMAATRHASPCVDGFAEGYACKNVDLLAHMDLLALGTTASGNGNDMWGWTDPESGKEYALVGLNNGTANSKTVINPPHLATDREGSRSNGTLKTPHQLDDRLTVN